MEDKLNLNAVENYSISYAEKVAASFFKDHKIITGPQILALSGIKQINLFILRELFSAWNKEILRLKSPYFNYDAKEVKEASTHYQNVLSKNISVSKNELQPLLIKATARTLFLIMDPYDFYSEMLDQKEGSGIAIKDLESEIKYVQVNRPPLESLVQKMKEKNLASIKGSEAFAILDHILEEVNFAPEDVEVYIQKFSEVTPLTFEMLYAKRGTEKKEAKKTLNEVGEARTTMNESLGPKSKPSLAEDFQKIEKIKEKLTINQKFMFTKILFEGDFDVFSRTVDFIDECNSFDQAVRYLDKSFPGWDREGEEYEEFIQLVEKRF